MFEATHDQILRLAARSAIRGLRVDHIDGLRDPVGYLNRLNERCSSSRRRLRLPMSWWKKFSPKMSCCRMTGQFQARPDTNI